MTLNGRRFTQALAMAGAMLALTATPSMAIVGGHNTANGAYPSVAEITFGNAFLCSGTLIAPNYVLTAGHCGSITGDAVATPASWPAPLIDVTIGGDTATTGERATVSPEIVR